MKSIYKSISFVIIASLVLFIPPRLRADGPLGFAAVAAMYVVGGAAIAVAVATKSDETETTETDTEQTTTTDSGDSDAEEEDGRGENEGTSGLTGGNKKPIIFTDSTTRGSWFQSTTTTALYGAAIPASEAPSGARIGAAKATVPGAGVQYRSIREKGDVLQTPTKISKITYKRTRSTTLKITRKGAADKVLSVPVRISSDELRAETVDVAGTNGNSSSKLSVLVNGKSKFEISVTVSQAQMPVFSSLPSGATKEERNDFGSIKNVDKEITVRLPRGKRTALVKLVIETEGEGRRL